jgi:hypothetical protein
VCVPSYTHMRCWLLCVPLPSHFSPSANGTLGDGGHRCAEVFAGLDNVVSAEMLWVDSLGCDIRAKLSDAAPVEIRLPFVRRVEDERDARSSLTMMGQLAWELQVRVSALPSASE